MTIRRHPNLVLLLIAVLAWPWAITATGMPSATSEAAPRGSSTVGLAGKAVREGQSDAGAWASPLDESDDVEGVDDALTCWLAPPPCGFDFWDRLCPASPSPGRAAPAASGPWRAFPPLRC